MIPVPEANRKAADEYRKTLRDMKRHEVKVEEMPEDVAQSMLALHQNALMVWMIDQHNSGKRRSRFLQRYEEPTP